MFCNQFENMESDGLSRFSTSVRDSQRVCLSPRFSDYTYYYIIDFQGLCKFCSLTRSDLNKYECIISLTWISSSVQMTTTLHFILLLLPCDSVAETQCIIHKDASNDMCLFDDCFDCICKDNSWLLSHILSKHYTNSNYSISYVRQGSQPNSHSHWFALLHSKLQVLYQVIFAHWISHYIILCCLCLHRLSRAVQVLVDCIELNKMSVLFHLHEYQVQFKWLLLFTYPFAFAVWQSQRRNV